MTVGGVLDTLTSSDTLVVVNRKASALGAGWWVAGYERLVRLPGGGFLWVGGDGSTRRYVRDTTRTGEAYGAAGYDRPDSLVLEGATYVRKLRHGARVEFDANGRHVATKDALGIATTFDNDPTTGRLRAITHPSASQPQHLFFYSGSTPLLDSVTAPAPIGAARRKVTLTHAQRGKVRNAARSRSTTLRLRRQIRVTAFSDPAKDAAGQTTIAVRSVSRRWNRAGSYRAIRPSAVSTFAKHALRAIRDGNAAWIGIRVPWLRGDNQRISRPSVRETTTFGAARIELDFIELPMRRSSPTPWRYGVSSLCAGPD